MLAEVILATPAVLVVAPPTVPLAIGLLLFRQGHPSQHNIRLSRMMRSETGCCVLEGVGLVEGIHRAQDVLTERDPLSLLATAKGEIEQQPPNLVGISQLSVMRAIKGP